MKKIYSCIFALALLLISKVTFAALVYTPSNFKKDHAKIIVVIHGCLQSAESMALGTGWNQIADKNNLMVVYLQAPNGTNPLGCWNWYLPENQRKDSGQLKMARDEIKAIQQVWKIKNTEVYLTGISSGAATVAGLLACFPNEFTAAGIHSGPSYGLAQTLEEGEKVLKGGPPATQSKASCRPEEFKGSVLVIQGTADTVVNPLHAKRIIADFMKDAEAGTAKELNSGALVYSVTDYVSQSHRKGRLVSVTGLGHAWSGFAENLRYPELLGPKAKIPTVLPFFTDMGPSATNLIWDFFREVSPLPTSRPKMRKKSNP